MGMFRCLWRFPPADWEFQLQPASASPLLRTRFHLPTVHIEKRRIGSALVMTVRDSIEANFIPGALGIWSWMAERMDEIAEVGVVNYADEPRLFVLLVRDP